MESLSLEVYYNGDSGNDGILKINAISKAEASGFTLVTYTPDFLVIQRKNNQIHKAVIVEKRVRYMLMINIQG